jgi:guanosine-3',5'-bis(diphosphate) 3'-pyrophosphohydrolase
MSHSIQLLAALDFAADKHRNQRRKGRGDTPYVNHVIGVAHTLATVGGITDVVTLCAAVLHDTLEDTETTVQELDDRFGEAVRMVVEEVTDDKAIPKDERKQRQVEHAPHTSDRAKTLKLGDKICNVTDVIDDPAAGWSPERRTEYLDWSERVIAGCRGVNLALENHYDQLLQRGRQASSSWS